MTSSVLLLAGKWVGTYEGIESGRKGVIQFDLSQGSTYAEGKVIMNADDPAKATTVPIKFVEAAEKGMVKGVIGPYLEPQLKVQVETEFLGGRRGDVITGTFTTHPVGAADKGQKRQVEGDQAAVRRRRFSVALGFAFTSFDLRSRFAGRGGFAGRGRLVGRGRFAGRGGFAASRGQQRPHEEVPRDLDRLGLGGPRPEDVLPLGHHVERLGLGRGSIRARAAAPRAEGSRGRRARTGAARGSAPSRPPGRRERPTRRRPGSRGIPPRCGR